MKLDDPVRFVKGVGPKRSRYLQNLGIEQAQDLLYHLPNRYIHRKKVDSISRIPRSMTDSEEIVVTGTVGWYETRRIRGSQKLLEVGVKDETGTLVVTWFNLDYLADKLERGKSIRVAGEPEIKKGELRMTHPDFDYPYEESSREEDQFLEPVYPLTEGISQNQMRNIIQNAVDELILQLRPILPEHIREKRNLPPLARSVQMVHEPTSESEAQTGKKGLLYQKAFLFFFALHRSRKEAIHEQTEYPIEVEDRIDRRIRRRFPFDLTDAQNRAISDIKKDFSTDRPMYRLLQGDVGSGKTVVALYAILSAIASNYQTALMAPTSVLARQHHRTVDKYLSDSDVTYELLTGSTEKQKKQDIYDALKKGDIDLIIGTHALIEEHVEFDQLGLIVVDEQQRFGVRHRSELVSKADNPHVLVTTATPIPRSLALTVYGDLDISVIDEMPPGRQPVRTVLRPRAKLGPACDFIREKIQEGRQAFFVYPLVEESDELPLKSATEMHERLDTEFFPDLEIGLLHGGLADSQKNKVMKGFRKGEINILVSTIVIEVGIDVPNATIMVIDHAERYGLSQLHQLRGRIGRGDHKSYCILLSDKSGEKAQKRLEIFKRTNDGFKIAEEDLRLRGPGSLLGTRQHGMPEVDLLDLTSDTDFLQTCKQDARELFEDDPELEQFTNLRNALESRFPEHKQFIRSG